MTAGPLVADRRLAGNHRRCGPACWSERRDRRHPGGLPGRGQEDYEPVPAALDLHSRSGAQEATEYRAKYRLGQIARSGSYFVLWGEVSPSSA